MKNRKRERKGEKEKKVANGYDLNNHLNIFFLFSEMYI